MALTFSQRHHPLLLREHQIHSLLGIWLSVLINQICKSCLLFLVLRESIHDLIFLSSMYSENFFKEAGEVVDIRFATSREDGSFRGYGHVEFATAEEAQKVIVVFTCE